MAQIMKPLDPTLPIMQLNHQDYFIRLFRDASGATEDFMQLFPQSE